MTKPDTRPKIHAKCINLLVSVGTEDRDRSIEEFYKEAEEALTKIARAKRVTLATNYYILDGKVCLTRDYDPKTQDFKPGATPPPWAGGPTPPRVKQTPVESALDSALDAVKTAKEQQ